MTPFHISLWETPTNKESWLKIDQRDLKISIGIKRESLRLSVSELWAFKLKKKFFGSGKCAFPGEIQRKRTTDGRNEFLKAKLSRIRNFRLIWKFSFIHVISYRRIFGFRSFQTIMPMRVPSFLKLAVLTNLDLLNRELKLRKSFSGFLNFLKIFSNQSVWKMTPFHISFSGTQTNWKY